MKRKQMIAVIEAAAGLNYLEWRAAAEQIERSFELKLNQTVLEISDAERTAVRMTLELGCEGDE